MQSAKCEAQSARWRRTVRSEILHFALRTFHFALLHNFSAIRTEVVDKESNVVSGEHEPNHGCSHVLSSIQEALLSARRKASIKPGKSSTIRLGGVAACSNSARVEMPVRIPAVCRPSAIAPEMSVS